MCRRMSIFKGGVGKRNCCLCYWLLVAGVATIWKIQRKFQSAFYSVILPLYIFSFLSLFSPCLAYICWLGWQHRSPNSLYIPCKINDGNSQFLLGLSLNPPRIFQTSSTSLGGTRFMTSMTKNTARPLTTTFAPRPVVSWKIVSFMDILLTSFLSRLQFARGSLNAVTTCSALSGVKVVRVYTIKRNCVLLIEERERERERVIGI